MKIIYIYASFVQFFQQLQPLLCEVLQGGKPLEYLDDGVSLFHTSAKLAKNRETAKSFNFFNTPTARRKGGMWHVA